MFVRGLVKKKSFWRRDFAWCSLMMRAVLYAGGRASYVWSGPPTSCRSAPVSPASCEAEIGPLLTPDHRGLASEDGGSPRHGGPALEEGGPVRGFKRLPARGLAVT